MEAHKKRDIFSSVAPLALGLYLFQSGARAEALSSLQSNLAPVNSASSPVLTFSTKDSSPSIVQLSSERFGVRSSEKEDLKPNHALEVVSEDSTGRSGGVLSQIRTFAANLAGNQTVDLVLGGVGVFLGFYGTAHLWYAAKRKLFPDALSGYVLEPVPRNNGSQDEYLSTRTATKVETTLKTIYGCSPNLVRVIRKAQEVAKEHPELPILFFDSKEGAEIFTMLRTSVSDTLASSPHVRALAYNAGIRFSDACKKVCGIEAKKMPSDLVTMEKMFAVFTYERFDAVAARLVVLPVKDVISLLTDPERWFDAAHRIPVTQDRDAALRRLVRHIEIATTLVLDRPEIFKQYLENYPKVFDALIHSTNVLRRMLLLLPDASLTFIEEWLKERASARLAHKAPRSFSQATLSIDEEERLEKLLRYSKGMSADPKNLLTYTNSCSSNGVVPPYRYEQRSHWHATIDIPIIGK